MKKKIKSSLLVKVFLITSIMLLCVSLLVFGLLAWLMPQTYSNRLNAVLDKRVQGFVSELEKTAFLDSGGLFDQFLQASSKSRLKPTMQVPTPSTRSSPR